MKLLSRRRPSPAMLIALIALVMAMGGSSIAQDAVTSAVKKISGKNIKKNAITSKHVKNGSLTARDLRPGTIPAAGGGLSKADADALYLAKAGKAADADKLDGQDSTAFLGAGAKAADADKLDGKDSADFLGKTEKAADSEKLDGLDSSQVVKGGGAIASGTLALSPGNSGTLIDLDGKPNLTAECVDSTFDFPRVTLEKPTSGSFAEAYMNDHSDDDNNTGTPDFEVRVPYNADSTTLTTSNLFAPRVATFNLTSRSLLGGSSITVYQVFMSGPHSGTCRFSAQAITQSFGGFKINPGPIFIPPS